jgi:hypothetical protein
MYAAVVCTEEEVELLLLENLLCSECARLCAVPGCDIYWHYLMTKYAEAETEISLCGLQFLVVVL